jgi:hypothetical protein
MYELDTGMAQGECKQYTVSNKWGLSAPTAPWFVEPNRKGNFVNQDAAQTDAGMALSQPTITLLVTFGSDCFRRRRHYDFPSAVYLSAACPKSSVCGQATRTISRATVSST